MTAIIRANPAHRARTRALHNRANPAGNGTIAMHAPNTLSLLVALACLAPVSTIAADTPAPAAPIATLTASECEVWNRELAFAHSVATHDAAAFAELVHPGAAFESGQPQPLRGRAAIVDAWSGLIAGKGMRLSWYPSRVTIGGAADVAWSSGPVLFEWPDRPPEKRYATGTYHSVWTRDADGRWRVLFDEGAGRAPATAEDAERFRDQGPQACRGADARPG
jgi:ketosteroid isomerase-like protein